jgi:glycosyltransferase involved in cell wall biosynthesis
MIDMLDEIPSACLRLYHVVDEYSAYEGQTEMIRNLIREQEQKMLAQADAVIVVSEELYRAKSQLNSHTYLVPNAVNFEAYTAALADPALPKDLETIRPPRLGYIGLISERLNLDMLHELAQDNPQWSLVLLGEERVPHQAETWEALRALPNVHYLGAVSVARVPAYVKGFHVGLMPYARDRQAESISPLKLYDYMAAGIPIASEDIPAVREFASFVHVAQPGEFDRAVRHALADSAPSRRETRRNAAAQHTWHTRVEELSTIIEGLLDHSSRLGGR